MAKKKLGVAIFGAGGHGKVLCDILLEGGHDVAGFLDDNPAKKGSKVLGLPVLGGWDDAKKAGLLVALGIGDNVVRERLYKKAKELGLGVATAIHPRAFVSRFAEIGEGAAVMAGAVVSPACVVGIGAVVNTGATIDHDCRLEPFSQVWPGAHLAGTVLVGARAYVGTGVAAKPNVKIGADSIIGAGAAIVSDIPERVVAAGVPCKVLKRRDA